MKNSLVLLLVLVFSVLPASANPQSSSDSRYLEPVYDPLAQSGNQSRKTNDSKSNNSYKDYDDDDSNAVMKEKNSSSSKSDSTQSKPGKVSHINQILNRLVLVERSEEGTIHVKAPFVNLNIKEHDVRVKAPMVDVSTKDSAVKVKAPFVNISH